MRIWVYMYTSPDTAGELRHHPPTHIFGTRPATQLCNGRISVFCQFLSTPRQRSAPKPICFLSHRYGGQRVSWWVGLLNSYSWLPGFLWMRVSMFVGGWSRDCCYLTLYMITYCWEMTWGMTYVLWKYRRGQHACCVTTLLWHRWWLHVPRNRVSLCLNVI